MAPDVLMNGMYQFCTTAELFAFEHFRYLASLQQLPTQCELKCCLHHPEAQPLEVFLHKERIKYLKTIAASLCKFLDLIFRENVMISAYRILQKLLS